MGVVTAHACDGWVHTLRGEKVVFTGRVLVDGNTTTQEQCAARVEGKHGDPRRKFSSQVSLVVHGDLTGAVVIDGQHRYSHKLVSARLARLDGRHVHVVDAAGFSDLLHGHAVPCRRLRRTKQFVEVVATPGDLVLGGPFVDHRVSKNNSKGDARVLTVDLAALEGATAAHEHTVRLLSARLKQDGVTARRHARRGPRFDLGWTQKRRVYIAEVKSLTGAREDQQIRLGLGQLLDYAHQLRQHARVIQPVLVLERRPTGARWPELASSLNVVLTWGPDFRDVRERIA